VRDSLKSSATIKHLGCPSCGSPANSLARLFRIATSFDNPWKREVFVSATMNDSPWLIRHRGIDEDLCLRISSWFSNRIAIRECESVDGEGTHIAEWCT
jgi:hypothetical protein